MTGREIDRTYCGEEAVPMTERNAQDGDGETAVCHVCDRRFSTQEELLKHLEETHPGDLLPDPSGP